MARICEQAPIEGSDALSMMDHRAQDNDFDSIQSSSARERMIMVQSTYQAPSSMYSAENRESFQ